MEDNLSHDSQIAFRRAKMDYEDPPVNTLRFGYEDGRFDKMARELKYSDDVLKLKVLREINEDFRDMTKIVRAMNTSDVVHVLVGHLENKHDEIRLLASQSMIEICYVFRGRELIIENNYILKIAHLRDDAVPKIRWNCYKSLYNLAEMVDGTNAELADEILEMLVDKLLEEKEEDILYLILQLMKRLFLGEGAIPRLLKTQGIIRLTHLLDKSVEGLREFAVLNLASISFPEDGKARVQELGCVVPLLSLLNDNSSRVREAATLALCSLAQLKETKVEVLENKYFEKILSMLEEKSENILANVIELIAYIAEEPEGRAMAKNYLGKLKELRQDNNYEFLHQYIDETVWVIEWTP